MIYQIDKKQLLVEASQPTTANAATSAANVFKKFNRNEQDN